MGDLIPFEPRIRPEPYEIASPALEYDLMSVYKLLSMDYESGAVITSPTVETFEPYIRPDGSMQVGKFGMEDFEQRFSHTEVNPHRFYVNVYALQHCFKKIIKDENEAEFHNDLLTAAKLTVQTASEFKKTRNPHRVETALIGYWAMEMALSKELNHIEPANRRKSERIRAKMASDKKLPSIPNSEARTERRRTLGHMALFLEQIDPLLNTAVATVIRRRSQASAIIEE
ncbi:hypothetical protein H0X10_00065 [Candidatus Saccharibacteria bacterium]|nr:hypothetical protein [Candidatus Saccharibacteria bacterium]